MSNPVTSSYVAPNTFFAETVAEANAEALAYAQSQLTCPVVGNNRVVVWCPDLVHNYSVPRDTFHSYTQEAADLLATNYAYEHLVCP